MSVQYWTYAISELIEFPQLYREFTTPVPNREGSGRDKKISVITEVGFLDKSRLLSTTKARKEVAGQCSSRPEKFWEIEPCIATGTDPRYSAAFGQEASCSAGSRETHF